MAITDTLGIARKLKKGGVDGAQAEAHAEALEDTARAARDGLATKADIDTLEARLSERLSELSERLSTRLYYGLIALFLAIVSAILGLPELYG